MSLHSDTLSILIPSQSVIDLSQSNAACVSGEATNTNIIVSRWVDLAEARPHSLAHPL